MAELQRPFHTIIDYAHEFYTERKTYATAIKAVQEFALSPEQEPVSTYTAASPALFNLGKMPSGTIFRVTSDTKNMYGRNYQYWDWYEIENNHGAPPSLYQIKHTQEEEKVYSHRPVLTAGKSLHLQKIQHIPKISFIIGEFTQLFRKDVIDPELLIPEVLDVMTIDHHGTRQKANGVEEMKYVFTPRTSVFNAL